MSPGAQPPERARGTHGYVKGACAYCGEAGDTLDHVPPRNISQKFFLAGTGLKHHTVISCYFCNRTLSDKALLLTLESRRAYIKTRLWEKRLAEIRPVLSGRDVWVARRDHLRSLRESAMSGLLKRHGPDLPGWLPDVGR
jgi:hypothetical protein